MTYRLREELVGDGRRTRADDEMERGGCEHLRDDDVRKVERRDYRPSPLGRELYVERSEIFVSHT